MKKILLLTIALSAAFCANAAALTVNHTEAGNFEAELNAAIAAVEGLSAAQVTELTIISVPTTDNDGNEVDTYLNATDCSAIRSALSGSLTKIDMSQVKFAGNHTPGDQWGNTSLVKDMTKLKTAILPEGITQISGGAFYGCTALEYVQIPNSVKIIGSYAFQNCKKLNLDKLPDALTTVGASAFKTCSKLTTKQLPDGLERIEEEAFNESAVEFDVLPETLHYMGIKAFRNSHVTFKTIPNNFTQITDKQQDYYFGTNVFVNCTKMIDVIVPEFMWTKIPDQTYYIDPLPASRTITCRSLTAPAATVDSKNYYGVFGRSETFPNDHLYILKDAEASYKAKGPWNTMQMHFITTPVEISIVGTGADVAINHQHYDAEKVFKAGTYDIYEGTHKWTLTPTNSSYYITAVYYEETEPAAAPRKRVITADDNEEADEAEEPVTGKQTLYKAEGTPAVGTIPVKVEVPVTAKAGKLSVEYAHKSGSTTGIDDINAEAAFVRNGNIISVTDGTATLYDLTGKAITTAAEIDMTNLNTGVYILRCGARSLKIAR